MHIVRVLLNVSETDWTTDNWEKILFNFVLFTFSSSACLHFECSEDVQANLSSAAESVVVLWIEPSIQNDACGQVTVTKSHNPGDAFSEGVTVVSYTFEDTSGSTSSCNFTVTVQRNEARTSQGIHLLVWQGYDIWRGSLLLAKLLQIIRFLLPYVRRNMKFTGYWLITISISLNSQSTFFAIGEGNLY